MVDRGAVALAGLLTAAGTVHLARPGTFDSALPDALPGAKRAWEVGSGLAELGCAAVLVHPRTRRTGGYLAAALFVAVFPGNLHMVWTARTSRERVITVARLPLQLPLVWWAWRIARPRTGRA